MYVRVQPGALGAAYVKLSYLVPNIATGVQLITAWHGHLTDVEIMCNMGARIYKWLLGYPSVGCWVSKHALDHKVRGQFAQCGAHSPGSCSTRGIWRWLKPRNFRQTCRSF